MEEAENSTPNAEDDEVPHEADGHVEVVSGKEWDDAENCCCDDR